MGQYGCLHFVCGLFWTISLHHRLCHSGCLHFVCRLFWTISLYRAILDSYNLFADYSGLFHFVSGPIWILITLFEDYSGLFDFTSALPFWMLILCLRSILNYFTSSSESILDAISLRQLDHSGLCSTLCFRAILDSYNLFTDYSGLFNHVVSGPIWILITLFEDNSGLFHFTSALPFWMLILCLRTILNYFTSLVGQSEYL